MTVVLGGPIRAILAFKEEVLQEAFKRENIVMLETKSKVSLARKKMYFPLREKGKKGLLCHSREYPGLA